MSVLAACDQGSLDPILASCSDTGVGFQAPRIWRLSFGFCASKLLDLKTAKVGLKCTGGILEGRGRGISREGVGGNWDS